MYLGLSSSAVLVVSSVSCAKPARPVSLVATMEAAQVLPTLLAGHSSKFVQIVLVAPVVVALLVPLVLLALLVLLVLLALLVLLVLLVLLYY